MGDPLFDKDISGTVSNGRNRAIRFRAGQEFGDIFEEGVEFDGLTLTVEVSGEDDAMSMIQAIEEIRAPVTNKDELERTATISVSLKAMSGYSASQTAAISPDQWCRICAILNEPAPQVDDDRMPVAQAS